MPGPGWCRGHWQDCSWRAASPADWPARVRRGTSPSAAARSTSCSPWSLLRWRSICWRVTYPYLSRRREIAPLRETHIETHMKRSNNPAGTNPGCTRRKALGLLGGGTALLGAGAASRSAFAQGGDDVLTEALVLRDPDVPA